MGFRRDADQRHVVPGSIKGDWITVVDGTASNPVAVNTNNTADGAPTSTTSTWSASTVARVPIPNGATRCLIRQSVAASGVTIGANNSAIYCVVADANGVPTRLDQQDWASTTYITLTMNSTLASNAANSAGTRRYSPPASLTGLDCFGGQTLYILRAIASNHTGGATNPNIEVLFLN